LRAFYNVCSHRAHPLLEGAGNIRLIVCPYHQWCYRADGCFRGARGRAGLEGGIPDNADLKPVRLENYAGFLFVNLDPDAVPLIEQAPGFLEDMYRCCPKLDRLSPVKRFERQVKANWKTLVDNNHECYHCDANHESLMELVDYRDKAVWKEDAITFTHTVERKRLDNTAYAVDEESIEQDSLFGYIWPNLIPLFFPGTPGLVMFQIQPLAPELSQLRHDFYLLSRQPSEQEKQFMNWFSHVLSEEDVSLCENVQRGLHSRGYRQGRFVVDRQQVEYSEHHVHFFQNLVREAVINY
jgi:choline monooxygenase